MVHNRVIANVPCDYKFKLTNKYFFVILLGGVSQLLMSCCCCCCCACLFLLCFVWVSESDVCASMWWQHTNWVHSAHQGASSLNKMRHHRSHTMRSEKKNFNYHFHSSWHINTTKNWFKCLPCASGHNIYVIINGLAF